MLFKMVRIVLLAGMLCSFPLSAWSANLLVNGAFNTPANGVPPGTTVTFTGCHDAGNSAAAHWTMWTNSCDTGSNDLSATLIPTTLPGATGYMQHIVTDGNLNGLVQRFASHSLTLTTVWIYVNSGCVTVGTGDGGNTLSDDTFCVAGQWFRMLKVPNGVSPSNEIVIYSAASPALGGQGADFYVESATVVVAP